MHYSENIGIASVSMYGRVMLTVTTTLGVIHMLNSNDLHDSRKLYQAFCDGMQELEELDKSYCHARQEAELAKMEMQDKERQVNRIWRQYVEVRKISQI